MDPALQMALGNPDRASPDPARREHFLIRRAQYALSLNDALHFPNWAAWHLGKRDLGHTGRGTFRPDTSLPSGFTVVTPANYTRSGYDRGHNCPSADRSANVRDNAAVFLMSNITPQAHGLNAGPWEKLEDYSRSLAKNGDDLFITCGHWFSAPTHGVIGRDKIAVPDFGWKIVVVVPPGPGDPVHRITATTRIIAVRMPNVNTVSRKDWREFRVSVGDIEQSTGLKFFDALPVSIAASLKNRVDFDKSSPSQRAKRRKHGADAPRSRHSEHTHHNARAMTVPYASAPIIASPTTYASALPRISSASNAGQVWINLRSKTYWRPGTEYYGRTKSGKYVSEADAIKAGYHAAGGR